MLEGNAVGLSGCDEWGTVRGRGEGAFSTLVIWRGGTVTVKSIDSRVLPALLLSQDMAALVMATKKRKPNLRW